MGRANGITYGIIFGIFIDLWIGKNIGIFSIMLGTIGCLGGYLDKSFSKDSRMIGAVKEKNIKGKVQFIIFPLNKISKEIMKFNADELYEKRLKEKKNLIKKIYALSKDISYKRKEGSNKLKNLHIDLQKNQ